MLGLPGYWRLYSPSPIQVLWGSVAGYEDPRILFFLPLEAGILPEACLKWKIRKKAKAVASLQKQLGLGKSHDSRDEGPLQSREGNDQDLIV